MRRAKTRSSERVHFNQFGRLSRHKRAQSSDQCLATRLGGSILRVGRQHGERHTSLTATDRFDHRVGLAEAVVKPVLERDQICNRDVGR
jgi:hypothetical protein